ncbi:MAG: hypothetical protein AB1485_00955 [Candidatus Thermoplasmatota archaeon]
MISGCGYACTECYQYLTKICSGCSRTNPVTKDCNIIVCLEEKKLPHCLKCSDRYKKGKVCEVYSSALRHCPLRLAFLKAIK